MYNLKNKRNMNKRKKGRHSNLWSFFERLDERMARCLLCREHIAYKSTTSNLKRHIERKHTTVQIIQPAIPQDNSEDTEYISTEPQIFHIPSPQKKVGQPATPRRIQIKLIPTHQVNTQPISEQEIYAQQLNLQHSAASKNSKSEETLVQSESDTNINDALLQLFIKDFHPFNIVEDEGFRNFIARLNPNYEIPSRKYISQILLPGIYEKCMENAKTITKTIKSACVTTECWTSSYDESFLAITVHFLDNDFYLKSVLLSCSLLDDNFTSESLADEINRCVNDWDLQDKIFFSVSSGEDYIANAFNAVLKWEHLGCFVHSVNKIIESGLSLKPVEELISKVRHIVSFFKNDSIASSELHLSQINCNIEPKKLKQDIPMLWSTTFYMMERFVELENAISCTVTIQESNLPLMQPDEWTVLKELTKVLKSLEAITKAVDQDNYMLASLPIVLANGLLEICQRLESRVELSKVTKQFVLKLKNGFNARFSELKKNPILSACTFLDPRFKSIPFGNNERQVKEHVVDLVIKHMHMDNDTQTIAESGTVSESQNIEELSLWGVFDKTAASTKVEVSVNSKAQLEVDRFLEEDLINRNTDPLEWWRLHRYSYPLLSEVVLQVFCSLATSVPFSRLFTKAGNIIVDRRSKLRASKLKQLVFLNTNDKLL